MSEQMPTFRTFAAFRLLGGITRPLMVATLVGGLGVVPGTAQETQRPAQASQTLFPPNGSGAAVMAPPALPATQVTSATSSQTGAVPNVPGATPAQLPLAPEAAAKKQHDLTPMGMFLSADPVVQGVMIVLTAASVATWIILLARGATLLLAKRRMSKALTALREADGLADASILVRKGVAARLLIATDDEVFRSNGLSSAGIKERTLMVLHRLESATARRMASGTGILATVGSIGPFVGLFGTVWGIMRSFIGIANTNTTSLAVVAPGIAEALLATGVGLAAAIPAVVIYNALARSITGYRAMVADAVALIMSHLSRDLDRQKAVAGCVQPNIQLAAE